MIVHLESIANEKVMVSCDHNENIVIVGLPLLGTLTNLKTFAGFEGLIEKYKELVEFFTDDTDYSFAISYFKPDFIQTLY